MQMLRTFSSRGSRLINRRIKSIMSDISWDFSDFISDKSVKSATPKETKTARSEGKSSELSKSIDGILCLNALSNQNTCYIRGKVRSLNNSLQLNEPMNAFNLDFVKIEYNDNLPENKKTQYKGKSRKSKQPKLSNVKKRRFSLEDSQEKGTTSATKTAETNDNRPENMVITNNDTSGKYIRTLYPNHPRVTIGVYRDKPNISDWDCSSDNGIIVPLDNRIPVIHVPKPSPMLRSPSHLHVIEITNWTNNGEHLRGKFLSGIAG